MDHKACAKRIIEPAIKDCERRIALKQQTLSDKYINELKKELTAVKELALQGGCSKKELILALKSLPKGTDSLIQAKTAYEAGLGA